MWATKKVLRVIFTSSSNSFIFACHISFKLLISSSLSSLSLSKSNFFSSSFCFCNIFLRLSHSNLSVSVHLAFKSLVSFSILTLSSSCESFDVVSCRKRACSSSLVSSSISLNCLSEVCLSLLKSLSSFWLNSSRLAFSVFVCVRSFCVDAN